jgi:hypothetical protein
MNKYIPFTQHDIERARNTDIAAFLQSRGERLKRSGSEYEWDGHHITIRGNMFFDQYGQEGGTAIDFVMKEYRMSFSEAVSTLLGQGSILPVKSGNTKMVKSAAIAKPFLLPKANDNMRRVYAYLIKRRGISPGAVSFFACKGLIYEDAHYHNAVFVGKDKNRIPRHAHKKSTSIDDSSFRGNVTGSDARYSFHHIGKSERIYVFEAPIDMLSFITINPEGWAQHSYVSLCSISPKALMYQLSENPHIKTPVLCLDNDDAGISASSSISAKLKEVGYKRTEILLPLAKDWNDDLMKVCSDEAYMEERQWAISQF